MNLKSTPFIVLFFLIHTTSFSQLIDCTKYGGFLTSQHGDLSPEENKYRIIDGSVQSKYVVFSPNTWLVFESPVAVVLNSYAISSANDAPERDPLSWTLSGSNDNGTWTVLDQRTNEDFPNRLQRRSFIVPVTVPYKYFKINLQNNSGSLLQVSELELWAEKGDFNTSLNPIFTSDYTQIGVGASVHFKNETENVNQFEWSFPGGTPSTSTLAEPIISYAVAGSYPVQLRVSNDSGHHMIHVNNYIEVHPTCDWGTSFITPTVLFTDYDNGTTSGSQVFHQVIPNPVTFMQDICLKVAQTLYRRSSQAPAFNQLTFELKNENFVAYKWGSGTSIGIAVSTQYLSDIYALSGNNAQVIKDEIEGILFHEVTHGYNNSPLTGGGYDGSSEFWAYTEGIADGVRIYKGHHQDRLPDITDNRKWLGGYTNTGFFLHYLTQEKDKNFLYKFNKSAKDLELFWSFDKALQMTLNRSVDSLWQDYVSFIANGGTLDYDGTYNWTLDCDSILLTQQEVDLNSILLYPNPVIDQLSIIPSVYWNTANLEYHCFDIKGRLIFKTTSNTIDCSALDPGVYLIEIYNNKGKSLGHQKFIKSSY